LQPRFSSPWLSYGLLLGVTVLSNPSVFSVIPCLLLFALLKVHRVDGPWLRNGLILLLTCAALWAPWGIRNHRVLHTTSPFRDGFWLEFYAGNNGDTSDSNPPASHPAGNPLEMQQYQSAGEIAYIAQKRVLALDFVQHNPHFFAGVSVRRAVRFWTGYWSFSRAYLTLQPLDIPNFFFCIFLLVFMFRGLRRWWQQEPAFALPYLTALILFPLPYYFTHSSMDYRQPIEPIILALVVIGIFGLQEEASSSSPLEEEALLPVFVREELEEEPAPVAAMGLAAIS
jgi:hypothetical protein